MEPFAGFSCQKLHEGVGCPEWMFPAQVRNVQRKCLKPFNNPASPVPENISDSAISSPLSAHIGLQSPTLIVGKTFHSMPCVLRSLRKVLHFCGSLQACLRPLACKHGLHTPHPISHRMLGTWHSQCPGWHIRPIQTGNQDNPLTLDFE